jgi:hypothetical protein
MLYCNPGREVHVIKGFCLWAFWDLELWLDEVYTGGCLGYVDLRHGSQTWDEVYTGGHLGYVDLRHGSQTLDEE